MIEEIAQLDELVGRIASADAKQLQNETDRFIAVLTRAFEPEANRQNPEALLNLDRQLAERQFIGGMLLRVLLYRSEAFAQRSWRQSLIRFLIATFDNVLRENKIDPKEQSVEKERALRDSLARCIEQFNSFVQETRTLENLGNTRSNFMKLINRVEIKSLIMPFVPFELVDRGRVKELFDSLDEYAVSDPIGKIDAYEKIRRHFEPYYQDIERSSSQYAAQFFEPFFAKLLAVLVDDYRSIEAIGDSTLTVKIADRKYPLHTPNHEFAITFVIENEGPGIALNLHLSVDSTLSLKHSHVNVSRLEPGSIRLSVTALSGALYEEACVSGTLAWNNAEGEHHELDLGISDLAPQTEDVQWSRIRPPVLYSIAPVSEEKDLLGRDDLLAELVESFQLPEVPSYFIFGQKRVGKTSVVKIFQKILQKHYPRFKTVFIESGDFRTTDALTTMNAFGRIVVQAPESVVRGAQGIAVPEFSGTIAPLGTYLNRLHDLDPDSKFLIIVDEFDDVPLEMYLRGPIGDTLFQNLRSISAKEYVGFVFVGSERMDQIFNQQGQKINRWESVELDYFTRDKDWNDFRALIKSPTAPWLEFSDAAIDTIYEYSAGNPYFTKLICRYVLEEAVERKDAFVSSEDVLSAVALAASKEQVPRFSHFWEDGILQSGDRAEAESITRRKILVAIADLLRRRTPNSRQALGTHAMLRALGERAVEEGVREFERRKILNRDEFDFSFKVRLFELWLKQSGTQQIITTFADEDAAIERQKQTERLMIQNSDIDEVCRGWIYQGRVINSENVRDWLNQFEEVKSQRAVFEVLKGIKYYSQEFIRSQMSKFYNLLRRRYETDENRFLTKRREFLIVHLDAGGKSGSAMARYFAEENRLLDGSVVSAEHLRTALLERTDAKAIIAIDDFIATGSTMKALVKQLFDRNGDLILSRGLRVHVFAVAGYEKALSEVRTFCEKLKFDVEFDVAELLTEQDTCFSEQSAIFSDPLLQEEAEQTARRFGTLLEPKWPIGYGELASTVIFEHNAPNNSLPILWSKSKGKAFRPLFGRL